MENSTETADLDYATRVAMMLVSSFPNQAHDPKVFQAQLAILFTGKSKSLLQAMTHPATGLVSECQFLTVAAAKAWLDKSGRRSFAPPRSSLPEHRLLPPPEEEPVSPEERERRVKMLKSVAQQLRLVTKHQVVGRPNETPEQARERIDAQFRKMQRPDTPENRASLLQTDLMRSYDDKPPQPHGQST